MPEEINRVVTDRVSDYLFAPSPDAVANLEAEGYRADQIILAGNVMVDTLLTNLDRARSRPILGELGLTAGEYGLVTLHRPANVDDNAVMKDLLGALGAIAHSLPLLLPAHPRTAAAIQGSDPPPGVHVVEPLGYLDFVAVEASARLVLTDSGGVQEETTVLGIPCLTLRENTERPITVSDGTNTVVGRDPKKIAAVANEVLTRGAERRRPALWDGQAGERIADALMSGHRTARLRPTGLDVERG
jgi:UDP-N-acetylglucosamine 2-epimerase (non-hydrolysing)